MLEQKEYRARIYEKYATNFQDASATFDAIKSLRWGSLYRHYLRGWLPENKESNILDVACGGGGLLYFYKVMSFKKISGVDISPEQVRIARQVTPNVTEADILKFLDTQTDTYDLISGLDIIEHFHKPEIFKFLDLCHSSLKSGGRLILQTPNAESPWGSVHRYNDFTHEVGFNPNSLGRLLSLAGFVDIEVREVGPVPFGHSIISTGRYFIWQAIRAGLKLWNLAETGAAGSGVFTRVFLISCVKP